MSPDVIVIGAGAIGTSIAYQLAKAGVKVMVFERGQVAGQATGASAGMIQINPDRTTPPAVSTLALESARLFPALATELEERTGMNIGYRPAPLLHVALHESDEPQLRAHRAWQVDHGVAVAWVDGAAIRDLEPTLNPAARAALYYPNDHQVMPVAFAQALARTAVDLGAVLREGEGIDRLLTAGDRVVGVAIGGETVHAGEIVIASGAWASSWSEALRTPIPVRPVRGQMVALRTTGTGLRNVVSSAEGYMLTKPDGLTYVGTTVEDVGYDARPTAAGIAGLLAFVPRLAPRLAGATFSSAWAGLRPGTPDGLPLLGRVPGWQGVSLAAGHFRSGILLAPITGELITDLLARRRPRLALDAFDPGRFLVRAA
ncbi:MAG TPA: glycine oxidase ThiO [Candidatus Dormibacteraeota bacterium]|nr:glycine oxidase ThiO [Candidatus Dormibacteraeota bacterium]